MKHPLAERDRVVAEAADDPITPGGVTSRRQRIGADFIRGTAAWGFILLIALIEKVISRSNMEGENRDLMHGVGRIAGWAARAVTVE